MYFCFIIQTTKNQPSAPYGNTPKAAVLTAFTRQPVMCGNGAPTGTIAMFTLATKTGDVLPPATGEYRVLRGGSWRSHSYGDFRCAYRDSHGPDRHHLNLGFRACKTL